MANIFQDALLAVDLNQLLLVWVVVVFASVMRAFTGFGFALVAVPVFSLLMAPAEAVVLSSSLALALSLISLRTYWGQYPVRDLFPMIALALVGTVLGASMLSSFSSQQFKLWVGLSVILASLVMAFYKPSRVKGTPTSSALVGLACGLMNGAFAIPGPPIIVYALATETDVRRVRAMLMTFFLFASGLGLATYAVAGFVTPASPWLFAMAMPALYAGDKLGYALFRRFGSTFYRRVALVVLLTIGIAITLKAVVGG